MNNIIRTESALNDYMKARGEFFMRDNIEKITGLFTRAKFWQYVAVFSFFVIVVARLIYFFQENEDSNAVKTDEILLPDACKNFTIVYGALHNASIVFLRETHFLNTTLEKMTVNPATLACVFALANLLPNFKKFDLYIEGAKKTQIASIKTNMIFGELCKKAQKCDTWEDDRALEAHFQLYRKFHIMLVTAALDEYVKNTLQKFDDATKMLLIEYSLEKKSLLLDSIDAISGVLPFHPQHSKINTIEIIRMLINPFLEDIKLYKRFNYYLETVIQAQKIVLAHKDCITEKLPINMAICTMHRAYQTIITERDKSLASHIKKTRKNKKKAFFIAGSAHGKDFTEKVLGGEAIVLKM